LSLDEQTLAKLFEASRPHLQGVAYRMLGSLPDADDAVQEAWLRLSRSDTAAVENLTGWLTTVVARICLDALRSRKTRLASDAEGPVFIPEDDPQNPEREALLAESVGLALLVVLEALEPAERIAFVLHDLFAVPFDDVASIVGRSPDAARQLASRARRRVRGAEPSSDSSSDPSGAALADQRRVVDGFLAALRSADFEGLVGVLGPEFVIRADATASPPNGSEVRGAETWAKQARAWTRGAKSARIVRVGGSVGVVLAPRGRLQRLLLFTFADGRIASAEIVADPTRLRETELSIFPD
jgi:RNA polymerase sigma factor (sigma-70 family)